VTSSDPAPVREVWRAPAKINLWLEIVGRRPDGYHEIDT
jgi:4-diphosphocytidyl-2-C-methyl-D-erythritol kinase